MYRLINWGGALLLGAASLAGADAVRCPATVETRQQIVSAASGWSAARDDAPHSLAGITFYDGKPEEKASLAPDSEARRNGKIISTWKFGDGGRPVYVACRYSGTNVTLTRELAKGVRSCEVTMNPKVNVAGLPEIEKIDCSEAR